MHDAFSGPRGHVLLWKDHSSFQKAGIRHSDSELVYSLPSLRDTDTVPIYLGFELKTHRSSVKVRKDIIM